MVQFKRQTGAREMPAPLMQSVEIYFPQRPFEVRWFTAPLQLIHGIRKDAAVSARIAKSVSYQRFHLWMKYGVR